MPLSELQKRLVAEIKKGDDADLEHIKFLVRDPAVLLTTSSTTFLHIAARIGEGKTFAILQIFLSQPWALFLINKNNQYQKLFSEYLDDDTTDLIYVVAEKTWDNWIEELLNSPEKADSMILEHQGQNILHLAIRYKLDTKIFEKLLTIPSIRNLINKSDEIGRTIVFHAAIYNLPFMKILIKNGADLSIKCDGGYTLWTYMYKLKKDFPTPEKRKLFTKVCNELTEHFSHEETSSDESSSDSESEENYQYQPFINNPQKKIPSEDEKQEIAVMNQKLHQGENVSFFDYPKISVAFFRGVHYLKNIFSQEEHRKLRKQSQIGKTVYASAVHELTNISPVDEAPDSQLLQKEARNLRRTINELKQEKTIEPVSGSGKLRMFKTPYAAFQQLYTNSYDNFHSAMQAQQPKEVFGKFKSNRNPLVSTAEGEALHGGKYGGGIKGFGKEGKRLMPNYHQETGKPKHPYLGKIYVILISAPELLDIDPSFVLKMHANNEITITTHFSNNILTEREASFPGFIPGQYIIYERNVRVPSFQGPHKDYYLDKYGLSKEKYENRQKKIFQTRRGTPERKEVVDEILNLIIKHMSKQLLAWTQNAAYERDSFLMYRDLDGGFSFAPPNLDEVKKRHNDLESNVTTEKMKTMTMEDTNAQSENFDKEEEEMQEIADLNDNFTSPERAVIEFKNLAKEILEKNYPITFKREKPNYLTISFDAAQSNFNNINIRNILQDLKKCFSKSKLLFSCLFEENFIDAHGHESEIKLASYILIKLGFEENNKKIEPVGCISEPQTFENLQKFIDQKSEETAINQLQSYLKESIDIIINGFTINYIYTEEKSTYKDLNFGKENSQTIWHINKTKYTLLHYAINQKKRLIVQWLLKNGADAEQSCQHFEGIKIEFDNPYMEDQNVTLTEKTCIQLAAEVGLEDMFNTTVKFGHF